MADETTVRNLRAPKEIFDRLSSLTKDNGFANQGQALEALLNAWQVQSAKDAIPEQRTAIEDFDSHVQAIQRAYLHLADIVQGAEARAMDTFRAKLEARETIIADLKQKLEEAEYKERTARNQQESALTSAMEANSRAEAAKEHATTLETALEETKANAAAQIMDKQRLIDSLTAQLAEAHEDAKTAAATTMEAVNLKEELAKAKQRLTDAQTAATIADAKATAERAEAIAAVQKDAQETILRMTNENAALKVQLAETKTQISKLETQIEKLLSAPTTETAAPMGDQPTPQNNINEKLYEITYVTKKGGEKTHTETITATSAEEAKAKFKAMRETSGAEAKAHAFQVEARAKK